MNIQTISVAVNYIDLLSYTWSKNKTEIDNYTVITDSKDTITHKFCKNNDINLFTTDAFYHDGASFSKSRALNEYFESIDITSTEWILLLDADIVLNGSLANFQHHCINKSLDSIVIPNHPCSFMKGIPLYVGKNKKTKIIYQDDPATKFSHGPYDIHLEDCLFSCSREIYNTKDDYIQKNFILESCCFYGYFHLFHINAIKDKLKNQQPVFSLHDTAAVYDTDFANEYWQFPHKKTINSSVHHLGPIEKNWQGRKTEKWS